MKNIAVFIGFVIIFHTFITSTGAWGQYSGPVLSQFPIKNKFSYALSVAPLAGFLYGYGEEIVYKSPGNDTFLSQLLWDIKPLWYTGGLLDFSRINPMEKMGFFTVLSLKFGFPGNTGIMEDRDWEAPADALSHYSRSDAYTNGALLLDYVLGLSLPLKQFALLKLYWGGSWMSFHWTSRDGYTQYASFSNNAYLPLDDSTPKRPLYGTSINYSQNWLISYPGAALCIPLPRGFRAALSFQISPLIYCVAWDDHLLRDIEFRDYITGGLYMEPRGDAAFSFGNRFELSLYVAYRFIKGAHGETYSRETGLNSGGEFTVNSEDAGAAWYALDSGLSLKIRL
jgi:outer membrane protease